MGYKVELEEEATGTVYAFPGKPRSFALWNTIRVEMTTTLGLHYGEISDELVETYENLWYFFDGSTTPSSYADSIGVVDLQPEIDARTLLARTTAGFITSAPVAVDGSIEEIIIGDDYLAANGRAFSWTVDAVQGFVVGDCTCSFGGKYKDNAWLVTGTITDNGDGTWTLSFNLPDTATANLEPGQYRWSVEVQHSGVEITRVKSDCTTKLVEKQT